MTSQAQITVEQVIEDSLVDIESRVTSADVTSVMQKTRAGAAVDYEEESQQFAAAYLLANYRKTLETLRLLPQADIRNVLDAGCGPGSATLAVLTFVAERRLRLQTLTLLDRALEPIRFASGLAVKAQRALQVECSIAIEHQTITEYESSCSLDLVVCSHVLCEQTSSDAGKLWGHLIRQLVDNGLALAVERAGDLASILTNLPADNEFAESQSGFISVSAPAPASTGLSRDWETGWHVARRPTEWMKELIEKYFHAWSTQNPELLQHVFSAGAKYHEKPFSQPMNGLEAIILYWKTKVLQQSSPAVKPIHISYGLLSATVEWQATFATERSSREVRGMLRVKFQPQDRLICELVEVFRARDLLN